MSLRLYNTLTRQKETFEAADGRTVRMYSCGPTVYDYIHLGNARAFVVPDVLKRYLRMSGFDVIHVQNITDIEDKIIGRAQEEGVEFQVIVDRYAQAYFDDLEALGCVKPDHNPKASEHIPEMIEIIQNLIERDLAYVNGGDVFFAVHNFPNYGRLSGQNLDDLVAGARVEVGEEKRHPADFALWKAAKPGEPYWESPWGRGRPGWHIECSAMSMHYLGQPFDIHTGGADLVFPHHENEIAQSEGATGETFARYWVHNGYINVDGEKMAKSRGNFFTLRDILKSYPAPVVRLFLLSKHYRSPIEFNREVIESTRRGYERLTEAVAALQRRVASEYVSPDRPETSDGLAAEIYEMVDRQRQQFRNGMDDDLNTAVALAAIYELARYANGWTHRPEAELTPPVQKALGNLLHELMFLADTLGLDLTSDPQSSGGTPELVDDLIGLLVQLRHEARQQRDFTLADRIRDGLSDIGIVLEDGADGTQWKMVDPDSGQES